MKPLILALAALCPLAQADDTFARIDPAPAKEFWLDSGFATYHFDRDKDLNGSNGGLGVEYRFRGDIAATAGRFYNGYPHMRDGGWFPALIPVATVEYKRFGVNFGFVPTYKDRLYGGLSVQLKFRLTQ
jgi:hypothetical protein